MMAGLAVAMVGTLLLLSGEKGRPARSPEIVRAATRPSYYTLRQTSTSQARTY